MSLVGKRERILALDLLRGYFLAVIVVDHLSYFPGMFEFVTGRGELWASAAEGFFIISGMLVGYVYAPRMFKSFRMAALKLWRRALYLYLCAVALTWIFVAWASHLPASSIKVGLWIDPPIGQYLYKTLTLKYTYGWADFLQYYVLFMLLAPFVLFLCTRGKAWLVVLVSGAIWLARGRNFTMGLQLIFMLGIVAGYYLPVIESWFKSLPLKIQKRTAAGIIALTGVMMLVSAAAVRASSTFVRNYDFSTLPGFVKPVTMWLITFQAATDHWVDKWTMAPLRVLTVLIWFTAFYIVFRVFEQRIDRWSRGFFKLLGQNSLFVYCLHAVTIFTMLAFAPHKYGFIGNTIMTAAILTMIYTVTRLSRPLVRYIKGLTATRWQLPQQPQDKEA